MTRSILVVDDERRFPDMERDHFVTYARSAMQAISMLLKTETGVTFDEVWFDHDLGLHDDAMEVVRFMEDAQATCSHVDHYSLIWPSRIGKAYVHSMNPVGANRLRAAISALGIPTRRVPLPENHTTIKTTKTEGDGR